MELQEAIKSLDNTIDRLLETSKEFINSTAIAQGLYDLAINGREEINELARDFEYFILTKSTKTLQGIKSLIELNLHEDVFVLVRNIYENYLNCRYLDYNVDKIRDFIHNPYNVAERYIELNRNGEYVDFHNNILGQRLNPSKLKIGKDKKYFFNFYDFLCTFTHCNYATVECYLGTNLKFTYEKNNYILISRLFTVFTFTKIFKLVVVRTTNMYNNLVCESISIQKHIFKVALKICEENLEDKKYKIIRDMLEHMKDSLDEEI